MNAFFDRLFARDGARLSRIQNDVDAVLARKSEMERLSDNELRSHFLELKQRVSDAKSLDAVRVEAFALVREAARRVIQEEPFPVQITGATVLHEGAIAEMKTGEGKTLVATMPVALNALTGNGVHIVTANEYLARRDAEWMGKIYAFLGLTVGVTLHGMSPEEKRAAYAADITYGTNNEFGFDYLRDNMAYRKADRVQRELSYAIVDECDSILIDEARTPLIISAPDEESSRQYLQFSRIAPQLERGKDYEVDEKQRAATLTDEGISKVEKLLGVENLYGSGEIRLVHHLEQALRAHVLYKRDVDYVVKDGEVVIVDAFTGRLMPGRRYSEGLHQAIEAKEGTKVQQESRTLATITFQNYFRLYKKIAGMTGTAKTSEEEFQKVYNLDVVVIPTNRPLVRVDHPDRIYATEMGKFKNVITEIKERHAKGQPVLVGTVAIEKSELVSRMLQREGVPHEVLNAKNHAREAEIIARAGSEGAVTISTNMAGRGTDIKLGVGVREKGGLHVIGTERHEARRIDNQLRGRSGRQGDSGSSQFFISAEDDVMRIFGADRMKRILERLNVPEDQPIESGMVSKAVEAAQARVEGFYFDARKHVLEYDDVMNKQRDSVYRLRRSIVESEGNADVLKKLAVEALAKALHEAIDIALLVPPAEGENIDPEQTVRTTIERFVNLKDDEWERIQMLLPGDLSKGIPETAIDALQIFTRERYEALVNATKADPSVFERIVRSMFLRALDLLWTDHLETMEYLRTGIGLRGYGQRDPLVEYRREGSQLFHTLLARFRSEVASAMFHLEIHPHVVSAPSPEAPRIADTMVLSHPTMDAPTGGVGREVDTVAPSGHVHSRNAQPATPTIVGAGKKQPTIGRNDPCPCGSGKKYKKCHGK